MKLKEINKKEFFDFCNTHQTNNFHQSRQWAEYKRLDGWHTYFVGLDQNGKIKAAAMLLSKEIPVIKRRVFYAPYGFIINYKDLELVRSFTKHITEFINNKKAIFVKIKPYLSLKELDNNGNYIQGGYDNSKCIDVLKSLNYIQMDTYLEANTFYKLNIKDKSYEDILNNMDETLKNTIISNEVKAIYSRDIESNEFDKIINIISNSSNKINHIGNNIKEFLQIFSDDKNVNVKVLEMNIDKYIENAKTDTEVKEAKEFEYNYGHKVIVGCVISVCFGNEVTTVCYAVQDKFKDMLIECSINYEVIKWAIENNYEIYNFGAIDDNLENNKLYQRYKGFNGNVVKLLGEFDLILNTFIYKQYYKHCKKKNITMNDLK